VQVEIDHTDGNTYRTALTSPINGTDWYCVYTQTLPATTGGGYADLNAYLYDASGTTLLASDGPHQIQIAALGNNCPSPPPPPPGG
jgi:hypothetical protein